MKYYTIIILIFLYACKKNDITPIENNNIVINENNCLDTCGFIIEKKHNMNDYPIINTELTVVTSCDTLKLERVHTMEDIIYYLGMEICFTRN